MTEDEEKAAYQRLALNALAIAAGNTLALWREGLLPKGAIPEMQERFRKTAEIFEELGSDDNAARYWTAANLIGRRPKGS